MKNSKSKRVTRQNKNNESPQEPQRLETVVTKEDWCIFIKNTKTGEISLLGSHLKKVAENLKKRKNEELDYIAKGPYLYKRNITEVPSLEEFEKLK